jgi:phage terminase large subunit-like protein
MRPVLDAERLSALLHDSPVLSMCVANTVVRMDAAGNRAPDNRESTHRIDGTVALITALATAPSVRVLERQRAPNARLYS